MSEQTPETTELESLYREFATEEPQLLAGRFASNYESLFPEDVLYSASTMAKLRDWYQSDFKPTVNNMGEEGARIWESLRHPDLLLNPKLLSAIFTVIVRLYFPKQAAAAIVALIVVLQQLVKDDVNRKAQ